MPQSEESGPIRSAQPGSIQIDTIDLAGARILRCTGDLDIAGEERLKEAVAVALGRTLTYLALDLRNLEFADLTVFRVIEYAAAACSRCHVTLYVNTGPVVRRLIDVMPRELLGGAAAYV